MSEERADVVRTHFGSDVQTFPHLTGTGANVIFATLPEEVAGEVRWMFSFNTNETEPWWRSHAPLADLRLDVGYGEAPFWPRVHRETR